ncbi:hypothetical protein ASM33_02535 [Wolbachia endosymbiont of Folsomia candida]|nr:hypothetical protein ASM33_02535 [Wolbachia endosymbiont of Folsomia candida]
MSAKSNSLLASIFSISELIEVAFEHANKSKVREKLMPSLRNSLNSVLLSSLNSFRTAMVLFILIGVKNREESPKEMQREILTIGVTVANRGDNNEDNSTIEIRIAHKKKILILLFLINSR